MSILEQILDVKKQEVLQLKKNPIDTGHLPHRTPFATRVTKDTHMSIIAEIKRASPSKGLIDGHVDPVKQALTYEQAGAQAISVLTDSTFFKGSYKDLQAVSNAVSLPVLCKDFIIDPVQIDYAAHHGATMILLIVAALDDHTLQELFIYAKNLHLEVLCEVHNVEEYERARKIGFSIIGVNNRDLHTFTVDLSITEKIAHLDQGHTEVFVSESGVQTKEDVQFVQQAGAKAILVGETFMRSDDLATTFAALRVKHLL